MIDHLLNIVITQLIVILSKGGKTDMKKIFKAKQKKHENILLARLLFILAIIASMEIMAGIVRLIEDISPYDLASYTSLQHSFVNNLTDHSFIIMGALALTLIIWGLTKDSW